MMGNLEHPSLAKTGGEGKKNNTFLMVLLRKS
jgi:hypothetical protein